MYAIVPNVMPVRVSAVRPVSFATPKSSSFPGVVGGGDRSSAFGGDPHGVGHGQRAACQALLERLALVVAHGDEDLPVRGLVDLVDGADVGMVERGGGLCLGAKAGPGLWILRQVERQELERDHPAQVRVLGLVDHAHGARAHPFEDPVVGNRLPNHTSCRQA
jgi:hypothetical protein